MQYSRTLFATAVATLLLSACGGGQESKPAVGIDPQVYTDSLFAVMNADRTNYTKMIIGRLGPAGADSIKPHEYWEDLENGAPLPAQMAAGVCVRLTAGCDKRLEICRFKFNNLLNFRGFPDVPEDDWLIVSPARAGAKSGGSRR